MYSFAGNPGKHRVEITFDGHFIREHDTFDALLKETVSKIRSSDGRFDCLIDMIKAPVAPQEVASRGGDAIQWAISNGLRKGAFVTGSTTGRMQMRRLSERNEKVEYFFCLDEARLWLDSEPFTPPASSP